uniref:Envelopment polyprotein n=1 Tax=Nova virus TaxID=660955 RepID=A0A1B1LUR8_9VIRU|nr:glycoprotein precursor [Nova virus]
MKLLLITLLVTITEQKSNFDLTLQCPHNPRQDEGFSYGCIVMPVQVYTALQQITVESSCPFEFHQLRKTLYSTTVVSWKKKTDTGTTTQAGDSTYEGTEENGSLLGICALDQGVSSKLITGRQGLVCQELSCNTTACLTTLHVVIPQQICSNVRSCIMTWKDHRINLNFEKTFCPNGLIVSGNCFQPLYGSSQLPTNVETTELQVTCFFVRERTGGHKVLVDLEKIGGAKSCTDNSFYSSYSCFLQGYSVRIKVPNLADAISAEIISKMIMFNYGEDHDKPGHGIGSFRISSEKEFKVANTESDKFKGLCLSGQILYTSTYVYPKPINHYTKYVLSKGVLPYVNYTTCDKKVMPLVWRGLVTVPGFSETMQPCNVFCTLAGPGAQCEAFSQTGIFNISSPTCLIGRMHKYHLMEDQINFVCQRLDKDIIVYCNGEKKVIKTATLVIGQCIYSLTTLFSMFPWIAHSMAVEVCVPGIHGWATIILMVTFCFGWLIIPSLTWIILQVLKVLIYVFNKKAGKLYFNHIFEKVKKEFQHTIGNTSCNLCQTDCETNEELKAHNELCPQGQCPYCLKDLAPSPAILTEHFKFCPLKDRYQKKVENIIAPLHPSSIVIRKVSNFRYKNRCYISMVWTLLLVIELCVWAASANVVDVDTEWNDVAHGVGHVPMASDYELDFSLPSGAGYTHRRYLDHPVNKDKSIMFTVSIKQQLVKATVQSLGHWMDGELNVKSVFHCYGECKKYSYPWQFAHCKFEKDYQYQTGWACNPSDCPGVGTGCTACGLYLDKIVPKASVYRILSLTYSRRICYQLGNEQSCKDIDQSDCLTSDHVKICMIGTVSNLNIGDTLVFLGPLAGGAIIMKQWCTSNCRYGDPGDIMMNSATLQCPDFDGVIERQCRFATEPVCVYNGNLISGYKKMMATRDSFISINMSDVTLGPSGLLWYDSDSIYKDHMNIQVSRDLAFEDLSENPCQLEISVQGITGSWGSGVGFTLDCSVSLTECSTFMTAIKVCDKAMCYGGKSVHLNRGQNSIKVQGRGGHSGSKFMCCHDKVCSKDGLKASAPHLDRVSGVNVLNSDAFSDGSDSCGFICWMTKVGEWMSGMFHSSWWIFLILFIVFIFSLLLLGLLCPARKH